MIVLFFDYEGYLEVYKGERERKEGKKGRLRKTRAVRFESHDGTVIDNIKFEIYMENKK